MVKIKEDIERLRAQTKTIALVGASARPERPSYAVMAFLQRSGYTVYPVNPGLAGQRLQGQTVCATLSDVAEPVDMVDIFRGSEQAEPIVKQAIAIGAKAIWMQLGVVNHAAATIARQAGLTVVMDRCPAIEWR